jgi:hypothetical protein
MMTARQWREQRHREGALVVNSTKAGQNVLHGVRRPMLHVYPATISNPKGVGMVQTQPKPVNPLNAKPRLVTKDRPRHNNRICKLGDCMRLLRPDRDE